MRILHTSDWHLGMPLKLGTMIEDQQYFLDQLYSIIGEYGADAVICAGDVYEIYPPVGFQKGNLDANGQALVLSATCALALKVVQNHRDGHIGLMAASHSLAN